MVKYESWTIVWLAPTLVHFVRPPRNKFQIEWIVYLLLGVMRWRSSTTATLGLLDVYCATSLLQIVPYNTKQSL